MTYRSLKRRVQKFLGVHPTPLKPRKPKQKPALPSNFEPVELSGGGTGAIIHIGREQIADLPTHTPDALVEMGRDVASEMLAHPEKHLTKVMGVDALIVDDAAYEAMFYLFAGKTRQRAWVEDKKVYAIQLHNVTVLSHSLLKEARLTEGGWQ